MICNKCDAEKDADTGFYVNDKTCKECRKAAVRENYRKNREHYREYEKGRASLPHRIFSRREYARTEAGKAAGNRAKVSYLERNPKKREAHNRVSNAIRDGKLVKQPCEICGYKVVHAHHDDYSKPLDVRWLCITHHNEWHNQNGEAVNG